LVPSGNPIPGGTMMVGQLYDIQLRLQNGNIDAQGDSVAGRLVPGAQIVVTLACVQANCSNTLPGTLTFQPVGGNGCAQSDSGVLSCTTFDSNTVIVKIDPAGSGVPFAPNERRVFATVRVQATTPIASPPSGTFFLRDDSGASDFEGPGPAFGGG